MGAVLKFPENTKIRQFRADQGMATPEYDRIFKQIENRKDYLKTQAEWHGIELNTVLYIADLLGPNEDFDGLVTALEDYNDEMYF